MHPDDPRYFWTAEARERRGAVLGALDASQSHRAAEQLRADRELAATGAGAAAGRAAARARHPRT